MGGRVCHNLPGRSPLAKGRATLEEAREIKKEFKGEERLFKAIELYALATGRGKVTREGNTIVYDNPQCTACKNQKSDSPFCTIYNGMIDAYIKWSEVDGVQAVETKCMAMGDDTCRFEVLPKK